MVIVLIGNKSDLGHMREVGEEEGRKLAEQEDLYFMETSALQNVNVEDAFLRMITQIHRINTQRNLEAKIKDTTTSTTTQTTTIPRGSQVLLSIDEVSATKSASCCHY